MKLGIDMEQKSDVEFRAEKLYKSKRENFNFLIREVVSNAIHATIIRLKNETTPYFQSKVEIIFLVEENNVEIVVKDNGEGFTPLNRKYFTRLDTQNFQKEKLRFYPMGQGRLSIIYFSDEAIYQSVYKDENGEYKRNSFNYPDNSPSLFDIDDLKCDKAEKVDSGTTLTLNIRKQQTYKRANTFFKKYNDIEKIENWFIENFFPFFMEIESLELLINFNGQKVNINKSYIEKNVECITFSVNFDGNDDNEPEDNDESENIKDFKIWLVKKENSQKTKNQITCFARHLSVEIEGGKIEYEIELSSSYDWFLTSEYFDDNVEQKGDKIVIPSNHIEKIQFNMSTVLDKHFSSQINQNRFETKKSVNSAKEKYPSLSLFIDEKNASSTRTILKESDLLKTAIEYKGKIEKAYWINQELENEDVGKLLNSSLHIYIDHRKRILKRFEGLIKKFNDEGEIKNELEDDIHDLFLKRGENLMTSVNKNHLHNLWILDDKYTIFSETFGSMSTRKGQKASDIYLWADDPNSPKEILILELKSPSNAHNAGNKYESMVAQVKRYASTFYKDPKKLLNWDTDPNRILYFGIILARKSDVYKEVRSNNIGGKPIKIPFLSASYFFNDEFSIDDSNSNAPQFKDIRIEMYAYEDIFQLATSRNDVFFRLLKGEFSIEDET